VKYKASLSHELRVFGGRGPPDNINMYKLLNSVRLNQYTVHVYYNSINHPDVIIYTAFACRAADIRQQLYLVFFIPASESPLLAIKECLCIQHDTLGSPSIHKK